MDQNNNKDNHEVEIEINTEMNQENKKVKSKRIKLFKIF